MRSCDSFTVTLLPPASAKWSHPPQPTGCRSPAPGGVLAPACPQPSLSCTRTGDKNALQTPCPLPSLVSQPPIQAGSRAQGWWPPSPSSRQELTPQPPCADTTQQPETNLDLKTSKYACPEARFYNSPHVPRRHYWGAAPPHAGLGSGLDTDPHPRAKSSPLEPGNVALLGNRVFTGVGK